MGQRPACFGLRDLEVQFQFGDGAVDAIDTALRSGLAKFYPQLEARGRAS